MENERSYYARIVKAEMKVIDALGNTVHVTLIEPKKNVCSEHRFFIDKVTKPDGTNAISYRVSDLGMHSTTDPMLIATHAATKACMAIVRSNDSQVGPQGIAPSS